MTVFRIQFPLELTDPYSVNFVGRTSSALIDAETLSQSVDFYLVCRREHGVSDSTAVCESHKTGGVLLTAVACGTRNCTEHDAAWSLMGRCSQKIACQVLVALKISCITPFCVDGLHLCLVMSDVQQSVDCGTTYDCLQWVASSVNAWCFREWDN